MAAFFTQVFRMQKAASQGESSKNSFERVCKASQNLTSQKALDDTEGIEIRSDFR